MPASEAERLAGEAHEACPCKLAWHVSRYAEPPEYCDCLTWTKGGPGIPCTWPGHAAVNAALWAVFEAGRDYEERWQIQQPDGKDPPLPAWLPKGAAHGREE